MNVVIAAIHGILTGQTNPTWPDRLEAWMFQRDPEVKVLKKHYCAGPFPRWNCWVEDPRLAREIADELNLYTAATKKPGVWFIAHSNGAVIALLAAGLLIKQGTKVEGLILTGAACEPDIDLNGVLEWQCRGMLGSAIAYSSPDDRVLSLEPGRRRDGVVGLFARVAGWCWGKIIYPYGALGRSGWLLDGQSVGANEPRVPGAALFSRWFTGGHSVYFTPGNMLGTFERFYQDVKNANAEKLQRYKVTGKTLKCET